MVPHSGQGVWTQVQHTRTRSCCSPATSRTRRRADVDDASHVTHLQHHRFLGRNGTVCSASIGKISDTTRPWLDPALDAALPLGQLDPVESTGAEDKIIFLGSSSLRRQRLAAACGRKPGEPARDQKSLRPRSRLRARSSPYRCFLSSSPSLLLLLLSSPLSSNATSYCGAHS